MLQRFRDNKTKLDICPSYAHLLHSTAKQVISHRGKNEKVREMRICDVFVSVVVMLGSRRNPFYNTFFIQLYRTKNSHMSVIKFAVGVEDSFQVGQLTGYNPTTDPMFGYCFRDCSLWILLASTSISLAPWGLFFPVFFPERLEINHYLYARYLRKCFEPRSNIARWKKIV